MSSPLISTADLRDLLAGGAPVTVLDVRYRMGDGQSGPGEYSLGHVPGAVYVDLDTELADPPGPGGRHPLPATETFEAAMQRVATAGSGWVGELGVQVDVDRARHVAQ